MVPVGFLKACPIHLHFLFLIWCPTESYLIVSGHMFKIHIKHLFTKLCSLFMLVSNTPHVSQA
jgi:hypothetical protein